MRITNNRYMLKQLRAQNSEWFSKSNKRFFQDRQYFYMYSGKTGNPYLVRSTYSWSDMLGGQKRLTYRINIIEVEIVNNTYTGKESIGHLLDIEFETLEDVKKWLRAN